MVHAHVAVTTTFKLSRIATKHKAWYRRAKMTEVTEGLVGPSLTSLTNLTKLNRDESEAPAIRAAVVRSDMKNWIAGPV